MSHTEKHVQWELVSRAGRVVMAHGTLESARAQRDVLAAKDTHVLIVLVESTRTIVE